MFLQEFSYPNRNTLMGIPFYFASLIRSHPGIVRTIKSIEADVFGIDFNCLIHHYLEDENPIHSVLNALDNILKNVCKAKKVFLAFDGLVPYAKIVQQRYRRFKIKEEGLFDRNQISPDTLYMRELEQALKNRFPKIQMSPTQEPGEGEHKIFQEIKKLPADERKTICIYGLDADLILLSLFNHQLSDTHGMTLLRETGEDFTVLDIWKLLTYLPIEIEQYLILSVLCFGNDFMPSLGIFSLREDGYGRALEYYNKSGKPDLRTEEGREIFMEYTASKEAAYLKERVRLRKQPFEKAVVGNQMSRKYGLHILDGVLNMDPVVEAYWKTFHWTMHYFRTNEVLNWNWAYPYPDAPLVEDIVQCYETECESGELSYKIINQLQVILPQKSLKLANRRVKFIDEHYEETREPWMKRYEWEMKPRISIPWHPSSSLTAVCPL
jgi:5'-3' exonuclease